jgi:hypothetical protein
MAKKTGGKKPAFGSPEWNKKYGVKLKTKKKAK